MYAASTLARETKSSVAQSHAPAVFVVDDDTVGRESLELAIHCEGWDAIACASACEFISRSRVFSPCCAVINIAVPDLDGLDLLRRIIAERRDMPVIFYADASDVRMAVRAMKAGAMEFLSRPFENSAMTEAIRVAIACSEAEQGRESVRRVLLDRYATLSKREREVMALVARGLMNKQAGGELGISEITVKAHRGKVMQKMRATSFADLVGIAAALGLTAKREPAPATKYLVGVSATGGHS